MRMPVINTMAHVSKIASYSRSAHNIVMAFLLELGFVPGNIGFEFLITAVVLHAKDPVYLQSENLYAAVAEYYNHRYSKVTIEGAIRRAITEAWKNKSNAAWKRYILTMQDGIMEKPVNLTVIGYLSCALRLAQGCRTEEKEGTGYGIE